MRLDKIKERAELGGSSRGLVELKRVHDDLANAPCIAKAKWHEYAIIYSPPGAERDSLVRVLRSYFSCLDTTDRFYAGTTLGSYYYAQGQFDSSFYAFNEAFKSARINSDTNATTLSLSNLAALYSEMDWKSEALAMALSAYTLSQQSSKISDVTRLFLNNNVAGLELDLGYYDRAKRVLSDYELSELKSGAEEIHVLRAVNFARVQLYEAKGDEVKIARILGALEVNTTAWIMATSFAVADSLVGIEVYNFVHDAYLRKLTEVDKDSSAFVAFGLPALGVIAMNRRVDEQLRLRATMFRSYAERMPLGANRLSYKLAVAQMFKLSDYWEDYWMELEAIKRRDIKYATLQSEVLNEFNNQVGIENSILRELSATKLLVRSLVGVASVLLASALALLFWVNARYKQSLKAHRVLVAENERLAKDHLVQLTYFDEVKALVRKAGKTIKVEVLDDLLARMERDRPSALIEIPDSALKPFDLTPTEAKVLIQLAYGYRNAEIAQMLNISKSYIHNVRSKLRQKLPLQPNEEIEEFAASLRKSYEPTKLQGSERTSR